MKGTNIQVLATAYAGVLFRKSLTAPQLRPWDSRILDAPVPDGPGLVEQPHPVKRLRARPLSRKQPGVVYIVHVGRGIYKIGHTGNLERRLRSLNCGRLKKLLPAHSIQAKDPALVEWLLHRALREMNVVNELFRLDGATLNKLRRIVSLGEDAEVVLREYFAD